MDPVVVLRGCVLAAVVGVGLSGCATGTSSTTVGPTVTTTTTTTSRAGPGKTVVHNYRTYQAGQTGVISSPAQHAKLLVTVGRPSRSTVRLSPTYGYSPQHGHYVTFALTIRNRGQVPIAIRRLDFWVRTPGARKTTTDDGNAPYSGSGSQLDTTELSPGQSVSNNLTFDVANPTGTLFYSPLGRKALAWTF